MEIFEGEIIKHRLLSEGLALTIGNFDGVHKGHVSLIRQLQEQGKLRKLRTAVLTFDPHPSQYFQEKNFRVLSEKADKIAKISQLGIETLFIQNFDKKFADLSKEDFLRQYLLKSLSPQWVLFGYDFRFGKGGLGDFCYANETLKVVGVGLGQGVPLKENGDVISSSLIRRKIQDTEVEMANQLLGYGYRIKGKVVSGRGLGRQMGFPTANLAEVSVLIPGSAVYVGWAWVSGKKKKAVLNIGNRPTVENTLAVHVECHILDFSEDLYGQCLQFEFVKKLRGEVKFPSIKALQKQIMADIEDARECLGDLG